MHGLKAVFTFLVGLFRFAVVEPRPTHDAVGIEPGHLPRSLQGKTRIPLPAVLRLAGKRSEQRLAAHAMHPDIPLCRIVVHAVPSAVLHRKGGVNH